MADVSLSWSQFKSQVDSRGITIQYTSNPTSYYLIAFDNLMQFVCSLPKDNGADQTDFETNYKPLCNTVNRLKVDAQVTSALPGVLPAITNILRYDDMNVANGGVARDSSISSSYVTLYNVNGEGNLFGFALTFEGSLLGADPFLVKLTIDSTIVFEVRTDDLGDSALYNMSTSQDINIIGLAVTGQTLKMRVPANLSMRYASNISIAIKKASGSSKRFRAGIVALTKE